METTESQVKIDIVEQRKPLNPKLPENAGNWD
jgi:hypothetical protein